MKRLVLVLVLAVGICVGGYFAAYHFALHPVRCEMKSSDCGMAWLAREYHLSPAQSAKIARMHDDYRPTCEAMCRRVAEANDKLTGLIAASPTVTPEIEGALKNWALLQNECRVAMLRHVYAVSAEMNPEEGRRYVLMATARIAAPGMDHAALLSK
jgi:hypothetical protein